MKKPKILYHGSPKNKLKNIKPQKQIFRDKAELVLVFATPYLPLAMIFATNLSYKWAQIGRFGKHFYMVIKNSQKSKIKKSDGSVYILEGKDFSYDPQKGMGFYEWFSKYPIKPIKSIFYPSLLKAMIKNKVNIYFVDNKMFQEIKKSKDHGYKILQKLSPEK